MTMVRKFQALKQLCKQQPYSVMRTILRFTGAVNNDLVAAEARYHKACHATYISKTICIMRGGKKHLMT